MDVLALASSAGLGGGIERYVDEVVERLRELGEEVDCFAVVSKPGRPSRISKARFAWRACVAMRAHRPTLLLVFHPGLLPVALVARAVARRPGMPMKAFFYGQDIWAMSRLSMWCASRSSVEVVSISEFSAGALSRVANARVIPPGLTERWRNSLLAVSRDDKVPSGPKELLSVFRLADYRTKGLPVLVEAIELLRQEGTELNLTIAGVGPVPEPVRSLMARHSWLRVIESPHDNDLRDLYARAELVVLATRRTAGAHSSGEGFGIVLLEAQLAGAPVVAPAFGGSRSAYLDGISGLAPTDESAVALAQVLRRCARSRGELARMGRNGRTWAALVTQSGRRRALIATLLPAGGTNRDDSVVEHPLAVRLLVDSEGSSPRGHHDEPRQHL